MLQDVKEKVMQFGVSSPTLLGVTGNLQRCGHFQPPPIPDRVKYALRSSKMYVSFSLILIFRFRAWCKTNTWYCAKRKYQNT